MGTCRTSCASSGGAECGADSVHKAWVGMRERVFTISLENEDEVEAYDQGLLHSSGCRMKNVAKGKSAGVWKWPQRPHVPCGQQPAGGVGSESIPTSHPRGTYRQAFIPCAGRVQPRSIHRPGQKVAPILFLQSPPRSIQINYCHRCWGRAHLSTN